CSEVRESDFYVVFFAGGGAPIQRAKPAASPPSRTPPRWGDARSGEDKGMRGGAPCIVNGAVGEWRGL
ncbi:MAG: hypothetical protein RJA70_4355, partial [Pseudomonadota bacterium]